MQRVFYGLRERPAGSVMFFSTLQWLVFSLANIITVPIVLGHAFGLDAHAIAAYTDRTFFVCGLIGLLQVVLGHRYPIIEGPAGMWWGVFLVLIQMTKDVGGSLPDLLRELELGLLAGAAVFVLLGITGALTFIRRLFTPVVTGTFLILLSLQLSKSLIAGVLGIGFMKGNSVEPTIVLLSLLLIVFTIGLMVKGKGLVSSLAVLIGLAVGWIVYAALGKVQFPTSHEPLISLPQLLPFGPMKVNVGVIATCVITAIILLSNLIASIQALEAAAKDSSSAAVFNRGSLVTGIGTLIAGVFGTPGAVPLTAAASLISLTGIASRLPFLIASALVALLGFFPVIGEWVTTLPSPVGYAILFTVFGQLLGFGLRDYKQLRLDQRDLFVVSLSVLTGVGIFFIPGEAWNSVPPLLGYILDNGLIVGVILVLLLEHLVFRRRETRVE